MLIPSLAMSAPFVFPPQPLRSAEPLPSILHTRFHSGAKRGRGKSVSWPPEDQICQIQFFLSNDAPASIVSGQTGFQSFNEMGLSAQACHLNASLDVPPGFHGVAKRARINMALDVAMSAEMAWCCPQKFIQDPNWLVADGDESKDVAIQKERELRVLEAFYPRSTSIPDSPTEAAEPAKCIDDNLVQIIPLVAIEEEDVYSEDVVKEESDPDKGAAIGQGKPNNDQTRQLSINGFPAQLRSFMKPLQKPIMDPKMANGLVDQDLLLEILRNPALLKGLTLFNASGEEFTGPMNQNEIGRNGQATLNPHIISKCVDALNNKGPHAGSSMNTGFPSPVSVLSDWEPELSSKNSQKNPSNPSNRGDSAAKLMASCLGSSLRQSHNAYSTSNSNVEMEPLPAFAEDSRPGMNASHEASTQAKSLVHIERSCSRVGALTPITCQNMGTIHDRSSYADGRRRGMQNEIPTFGPMSKKSVRLCMYYNTSRGCRNGGNCAFVHQAASRELNPTAPAHSTAICLEMGKAGHGCLKLYCQLTALLGGEDTVRIMGSSLLHSQHHFPGCVLAIAKLVMAVAVSYGGLLLRPPQGLYEEVWQEDNSWIIQRLKRWKHTMKYLSKMQSSITVQTECQSRDIAGICFPPEG